MADNPDDDSSSLLNAYRLDNRQPVNRRRLGVVLLLLVLLVLAACGVSLFALAGRNGASPGAAVSPVADTQEPVASSTQIVALQPTTEAQPSDTPAPATTTLAAPFVTETSLALAADVSDEPFTLNLQNLSAASDWISCVPVNSKLGNQLGQACMSLASAYTTDNGQLLSVAGRPAITAIWLRLDSLAGNSSELAGIATDPSSSALPAGNWNPAVVGTEFDLSVGNWRARATIKDVETTALPSAPDAAPALTELAVDMVVAAAGN